MSTAVRRVIKTSLFGGLGAILGFVIFLIAVLTYSPEWPDGITVWYAVIAGALIGLAAGLLWGKGAVRWMIEALMNI